MILYPIFVCVVAVGRVWRGSAWCLSVHSKLLVSLLRVAGCWDVTESRGGSAEGKIQSNEALTIITYNKAYVCRRAFPFKMFFVKPKSSQNVYTCVGGRWYLAFYCSYISCLYLYVCNKASATLGAWPSIKSGAQVQGGCRNVTCQDSGCDAAWQVRQTSVMNVSCVTLQGKHLMRSTGQGQH